MKLTMDDFLKDIKIKCLECGNIEKRDLTSNRHIFMCSKCNSRHIITHQKGEIIIELENHKILN